MSTPVETKRVNGRFLSPVTVGDLVVNADRQTAIVPRYRVVKLNRGTARLEGVDRELNLIIRLSAKARHVFKKVDTDDNSTT